VTQAFDAGRIFGRGISFPPRVTADGRVAWSEGEDNVREAVRVILMTEPRERVGVPELGGGLARFLFEPNTAATRRVIQDRITRALARWEPRLRVESVDVEPDPEDPAAAIATLTFTLVATQALQQMRLSIALTGS
jgi:phage baseplate assembly protein W